jgi:hypothetical protein
VRCAASRRIGRVLRGRVPRTPIPLRERPWDWLFVVGFSLFAMTSLLFDALAGLNVDFHTSTFPTAPLLIQYGAIDPLVLANPPYLAFMSAISAFVMGPYYLFAVYAVVRGRDWIKVPAIVHASCMSYSLAVHIAMEFLDRWPPTNTPAMLATYLPYAAIPLAFAIRTRHPHPFTREHGA